MGGAVATMTQAEFARHRGVSKKTVTIWKQRGLLVLTVDGSVDVAASEARLAERPESYRGGTVTQAGNAASPVQAKDARASPPSSEAVEALPADPSTWTTAQSQRAKEQALAQRQRRLEAQAAGRLVEVEAVALLVEADYAVVRNRLLGIPGKIAAHLVGLSAERIIAALSEEIAEALHELHDPAELAGRSRRTGGTPSPGEERA